MTKILIVEDEKNMIQLLKLELEHEGYVVDTAEDGDSGLDLALCNDYDLIVLDIMLPKKNGLEVCRRIRLKQDTPIIMLTARDTVMDKVQGLEMGADDYLAKPFALEELLARVRSLLRRSNTMKNHVSYKDIVLENDTFKVYRNQEEIFLTKKEFQILQIFITNIGKVIDRDAMIQKIWGYDSDGETNVVDVHIRHLREKLEDKGKIYIHTVRGVGYRFE